MYVFTHACIYMYVCIDIYIYIYIFIYLYRRRAGRRHRPREGAAREARGPEGTDLTVTLFEMISFEAVVLRTPLKGDSESGYVSLQGDPTGGSENNDFK